MPRQKIAKRRLILIRSTQRLLNDLDLSIVDIIERVAGRIYWQNIPEIIPR